MKNSIVFAITLLLGLYGSAQGFQNVVIESVDDLCFGNTSQSADPEAEAIVDEIMGQMGLNRNFKLRKCENIKNALAHIEEDENNNLVPYILYDPKWLGQMSKNSQMDWASIGVLAHEVGHFLLYHSLNRGGSNPRWELSADRFAGHTLARMGSTLEEAQSMFANVPEKGSSTHPGRTERLEAIKIGWMKYNDPNLKKIILDEDTAERDVTPELIINRYYSQLGGIKEVGQIKQLNFKETISETKGENFNQEPVVYVYDYQQSVNTIAILHKERQEQYLIKNDSLFWKYTDQDQWRNGAPPIGTSLKQDSYTFKRERKPATQYFFDDFLLLSNPEVAHYRGRRRMGNEECFLLELPQETIEIGNLNKKGKRIQLTKHYYFSTQSGLLYAIMENEKTEHFRKGKRKDQKTMEIKKIISEYDLHDQTYFPKEVQIIETELEYDLPKGDRLYQQRSISEVELLNEVK
ncbi:hypothetical protein J0X14_14605 [Muricauda sp. CAU 1633]|uniref:DUF2201 family putative metallopeptidase n=1 Tax=Allomuricauda sp. CAU 1633 TaxID=2816036 RepID=UPI001A902AAA|nr:hypothetical protein [Muricauda sp. CAU 1633]MBO0323537.1 hypothetical protein [Muricauda sp. CAU 1633]